MITPDLIAALIVAVNTNDIRTTPRLLEQLEVRLPLAEVVELLRRLPAMRRCSQRCRVRVDRLVPEGHSCY